MRLNSATASLIVFAVTAACSSDPATSGHFPTNADRDRWRNEVMACTVDDVVRVRDEHPVSIIYREHPNAQVAIFHMRSRAEAGDVEAMATLAGLLPYDDADPSTLEYARTAAQAGSPLAHFLLGISAKYGGWGQEQNLRLAETHFQRAFEVGVARAAFESSELYWLDGLEPAEGDRRTAQQIAIDYALMGAALCDPDALHLARQFAETSDAPADSELNTNISELLDALEAG